MTAAQGQERDHEPARPTAEGRRPRPQTPGTHATAPCPARPAPPTFPPGPLCGAWWPRTDDLIEDLIASVDLSTLKLTARGIAHMEVQPSIGLAAVVVQPGPEVLDFQGRLIDGLKPYVGSGGTADASVRTDAEPDINAATLAYIETCVPDHSGGNYLAHVTVGLATLADLASIEAEPFEALTFSGRGISVYHLGNNGTAARPLKSWAARRDA
ncbi:hypothetical protein ACGFS9_10615 [Streptomyces sp. NPDC048566]|uniref:hypothetical protein n=1 Tax=Streptomyces sp. NPDC048566 TaxID=3365569 RepID=UPI00371D8A5A